MAITVQIVGANGTSLIAGIRRPVGVLRRLCGAGHDHAAPTLLRESEQQLAA